MISESLIPESFEVDVALAVLTDQFDAKTAKSPTKDNRASSEGLHKNLIANTKFQRRHNIIVPKKAAKFKRFDMIAQQHKTQLAQLIKSSKKYASKSLNRVEQAREECRNWKKIKNKEEEDILK